MGRHGGKSPETAAPSRGHRRPRRRASGARTGLLSASAAVAVGAVAVVTGMLPTPSAVPGGSYLFGDGADGGNAARADGTPSALATDGGPSTAVAPGTAYGTGTAHRSSVSPTTSPTGASARPSAKVTRRPSATPKPARTTAAAAPSLLSASATAPAGKASSAAQQVLTLVNQQRATAGCRPLTFDAKLTQLAQNFSEEMAARGFFDHTDPDGKSPWDRAAGLDIGNLGGENIAEGQPDAAAVMDAWMHSPGHRANILNCDYRTIGIGVHDASGSQSGGPWWTQDFGF